MSDRIQFFYLQRWPSWRDVRLEGIDWWHISFKFMWKIYGSLEFKYHLPRSFSFLTFLASLQLSHQMSLSYFKTLVGWIDSHIGWNHLQLIQARFMSEVMSRLVARTMRTIILLTWWILLSIIEDRLDLPLEPFLLFWQSQTLLYVDKLWKGEIEIVSSKFVSVSIIITSFNYSLSR